MKSIIFVCLGNICRSPLAEGIAKKLNDDYQLGLTIASAGTGDWHIGEAPCPNSIKVAKQHHIDISHFRGQQVKKSDFSDFDVVVGLDDSNIANLKSLGCKTPLKLGDFGFHGDDVPDPYFFDGFDGFDKVFTMIETAVIKLFEEKIESYSKA
jgi:protein-tyrosine phosphatase